MKDFYLRLKYNEDKKTDKQTDRQKNLRDHKLYSPVAVAPVVTTVFEFVVVLLLLLVLAEAAEVVVLSVGKCLDADGGGVKNPPRNDMPAAVTL